MILLAGCAYFIAILVAIPVVILFITGLTIGIVYGLRAADIPSLCATLEECKSHCVDKGLNLTVTNATLILIIMMSMAVEAVHAFVPVKMGA